MKPNPLPGTETPEDNEAQIIKEIRDILVPAAGFTSVLGPFRLPHVKGHGCVAATFTVNDGLPVKLAVGFFAKPRTYPIQKRGRASKTRNMIPGSRPNRRAATARWAGSSRCLNWSKWSFAACSQ